MARSHSLLEIDEDKFAVAGELLVGALSIEQDLDALLPCQSGDAVLAVDAVASHRLFLVPEPGVELFPESLTTGKNVMRTAAGGGGDRVDIRPLVQTRLREAGAKSMLPVFAPCALPLQFGA